EGAVPQDIGALHAADRAQLGLHDAREIVSNLVLIEILGGETDVHRCKLRVCGLQFDDWSLGFWRKIIANLGNLGLNLRQRRVGVVIQLEMYGDGAKALRAGRLHVVDAIGAGNDTLEWGGDEPTDQVCVGANVHSCDLNLRDVAARILAHTERTDRLQTRNQDHQIDADCKNRSLYK